MIMFVLLNPNRDDINKPHKKKKNKELHIITSTSVNKQWHCISCLDCSRSAQHLNVRVE